MSYISGSSNQGYVSADDIGGHPLSGSGRMIPAPLGDNWEAGDTRYKNLPTSDPASAGALWVSGSSDGPDNSKYLMVSQG